MGAPPGRRHDQRLPNESQSYRAARDALLDAEVAIRHQIEEAARQRRRLPLGAEVPEDYVFHAYDDASGASRDVRLSELFAAGKDTLFLYSFMFVPDGSGNPIGHPCPNCTSIVDGLAGAAAHLERRINLAVSAKAPIEQFRSLGRSRGWDAVRQLSAAPSSFNRDYLAEADDGRQLPMATVFLRRDGRIHHWWSSEMLFVPGEEEARHVDFMWPLWNVLDHTPDGRGTHWMPSLDYADPRPGNAP